MKTLIYLGRLICAVTIIISAIIVFGEPNEGLTLSSVIMIKAVGFLCLIGGGKGYFALMPKEERDRIMNEEV